MRLNHFLLNTGTALLLITTWAQATYRIETDRYTFHANSEKNRHAIALKYNNQILLTSPSEGLWSIGSDWKNGWPAQWQHTHPEKVKQIGEWLIFTGRLQVEQGKWLLQDAYRRWNDLIEVRRRWTWTGENMLEKCTLSIRWQAPQAGAHTLLPGICYYGNPSGAKTAENRRVPIFQGNPGESAVFEEHRYPIPFASLEWSDRNEFYGAALHSIPSAVPYHNQTDQWWSLGVIGKENASEITLLSGPCAMNGKPGFVKANQNRLLKYSDTWLNIAPGAVIEKTFYLEVYPVQSRGTGFQTPLHNAFHIFQPTYVDDLPNFSEILAAKYRFTKSRWHEDAESAGIRMYPHNNDYVMGWAGQSGAPGYALLILADILGDPEALNMARKILDHLATSPFNENGFLIRYNPDKNQWYGQDPISQGQAMEVFGRAILAGRQIEQIETSTWETFLKKACDIHADRILHKNWRPKSTNEGFWVSPLCKGYQLFGNETYKQAALKAVEHYGKRHLDMTEPYWGGTLDARCEDKEGAWAGFQAFLAMYELTREKKYLDWAEHAMDVVLTYTVYWDIDMPPGRLRDQNFKSRGWTVVSAQNQHLDVYGVLYTPEIYRMGQYLKREQLKKLAILMYRTCGQFIDPHGSQGEQLNHTNFVQGMNIQDVTQMRGTYNESWTVYWIAAHFLNAAAQFVEMGVPIFEN